MVNPHFSLNPQNPGIYGAILRFSEDFYCEIHRFHWQSSDLAEDLSKSSSGSEEFILFVWVLVWQGDRVCILHNLSSDRPKFADGVSEISSQNTI